MAASLDADAADLATVEAIVRRAGTSFYRGMRVLPPDRRLAMYAIYAFCRIVDDIADEDDSLEQKRQLLGVWRDKITGLYQGRTDDAVTRVLKAAIERFKLREADFLAVIDGMQMDAETVIVAPSLVELDLYCDRVASAVGRLSVRAFGDSSETADKVAYALGRALQITNILRDVKEDADRGRIYLPREYLEEADVVADPVLLLAEPGLPAVCARLANRAHFYFEDARIAMESCNARAMKPARLMGATYKAVLKALERRGWTRLDEPVSVPSWKKVWLACRYGLL